MKSLTMALALTLCLQLAASAQIVVSAGAAENLNIPAPAAVVMIAVPERHPYRDALLFVPRKAWSGTKQLGRTIYKFNKKLKPAVEVIDTTTALGAAWFFWSRVAGGI